MSKVKITSSFSLRISESTTHILLLTFFLITYAYHVCREQWHKINPLLRPIYLFIYLFMYCYTMILRYILFWHPRLWFAYVKLKTFMGLRWRIWVVHVDIFNMVTNFGLYRSEPQTPWSEPPDLDKTNNYFRQNFENLVSATPEDLGLVRGKGNEKHR